MKYIKIGIKRFSILTFCLASLFFGVTIAYFSTNVEASFDGCGTIGNCYYVPSGCGENVGCTNVECDDKKCPLPGTNGVGCHYCVSTYPGEN